MKTIGIIGAGNIGQTVAAHFSKAGFPVLISNSKEPGTLKELAAQLGKSVKAVAAKDAAEADIILLALPWSKVKDITTLTNWNGKIVIDATNHFKPNFEVEDLGGRASSEVVQEYLPGARLVKAFNTLFYKILAADPVTENGHRVLFLSGDDPAAKAAVSQLITDIGFAPVDLGSLSVGSKFQEAKGVLSTLNLIRI